MLYYPDFSKIFHIYTDASDNRLGAVITQDDKPIAFCSKKLIISQKRYNTGEQEFLCDFETLREFLSILLGYKIVVHADHKNLTYARCTFDRVMRWRLLIEEFGPEFHYMKVKHKLISHALSRLERDAGDPQDKPTAQCMSAILARTACSLDELTSDHL
jgi:hypothetical protein